MSNKFEYKYSAPTKSEKDEINSIRNKYLPKNDSTTKLEELLKLDNKVHTIPLIFGLSFGIIGSLIFGVGLCFFLVWVSYWYVGIFFSFVGSVAMCINYFIYKRLLDDLKAQHSADIIRLSEEILKDEENR